jgi:hypothetical protein
MKALTVRQPWASAIIWGGKDIENRSWKPPKSLMPGDRLAIHAGKASFNIDLALRTFKNQPEVIKELFQVDLRRIAYGAIIGTVYLDGIIHSQYHNDDEIDNEWIDRNCAYWWCLSDPQPCEPVYVKGRQGLWEIDGELIKPIGGVE